MSGDTANYPQTSTGRLRVSRASLNPVLLDAPPPDRDGKAPGRFATPLTRALERHRLLLSAGFAGLCLLTSFLISFCEGPPLLGNVFTWLAFIVTGIPALGSVIESLKARRIDIDTLMLVGAIMAAVIGSAWEGALLLFLFAVSGGLEHYALNRTQSAIADLRKLAPDVAQLWKDGQTHTVRVESVNVGDAILIRPGDQIPLDGSIVEGDSSVNEAAITGESVPRSKSVGETVYAGTFNIDGRLVVSVTKTSGDTTVARIVKMVVDARHRKGRVEGLIDRLGPTYSMAVMVIAVLAAILLKPILGLDSWGESIRRGIALLIVGSPCALIIATPVAYLSAIAGAARNGILIKGGVYLEQLARTAVFAFDKTGTLTRGKVKLTAVVPLDGIDPNEALRLAGGIEGSSTHPMAKAVMEALAERELRPHLVDDFQSEAGQAVQGRIGNKHVWIGRPGLAREKMSEDDRVAFDRAIAESRAQGWTAAALLIDRHPVVLSFADEIRSGAVECLRLLRLYGAVRIVMLTGDDQQVAQSIGASLSVDEIHAELLPEEKVDRVQSLRARHGHLVMVGDGVNDAPALAYADVGVALGGIGSDAALEAADVVILNERIERIAWLYAHSKRTAAIVLQNLTLALGVISVLAGLAISGTVPLPLAVIGHEGSTVLVALNALRLLRK